MARLKALPAVESASAIAGLPLGGEGMACSFEIEGRPTLKGEYFDTIVADAVAIYMLSLFLDLDYYDLRERDYPLIAPSGLAERLRLVSELFPPSPGYEFQIFHRRKNLAFAHRLHQPRPNISPIVTGHFGFAGWHYQRVELTCTGIIFEL